MPILQRIHYFGLYRETYSDVEKIRLFDHFVGEREQLIWNGKAKYPGSRALTTKLNLEVSRTGRLACFPPETASAINARLTMHITQITAVAHEG